jgi:hypothetical protein
MFQSIKYIRHHGYNNTTKQYEYEYELIDSDFGEVVGVVVVASRSVACGPGAGAGAVIQEYGKRNLNVVANLIRCFHFYEKRYDWTIAEQIACAEECQSLFSPEIKADLTKYLILL